MNNTASRTAMRFVLLIGIVSLFADMTYEGARAITGPYLAVLGASATMVGIVAGFGEFVGYFLRLVSGYLADRTQYYWSITIIGYAVNLFAVPALALAGHWPLAALLMILERAGKAIRNPARDAMLSHATAQMGRGWGFGIHEALDQTGATVGPLVVAGILYFKEGYRSAFAALLIPALLAMVALFSARFLYPHPQSLETITPRLEPQGFGRNYWIYLAAVSCIALGYADYSLIAFHFEKAQHMPADWTAVFYSLAMASDGLAALLFGYWYDRKGIAILILAALASSFFAPLVFLGGFSMALAGAALWGIGMGAQESIMRAAVAAMTPKDRRGTAYGLFNMGFGLFWFLGSALMGFLYDRSIPALVGFSMAIQWLSIPLFIASSRLHRAGPANRS